jgi:DNA-binding XRE family transcriptional regulator
MAMATDIDLHLGRRLRRRRRLLGLTQQQLATQVGIRFQQIQKYECGANRISARQLFLRRPDRGAGAQRDRWRRGR